MDELDFRTVFREEKKNPYSRMVVDKIQERRSLLDNELFFDCLLVSFAKVEDGIPSPPAFSSVSD